MAEVTLTFAPEHAVRIQRALELRLPVYDENDDLVPADVAQFKQFLIAQTKQFVHSSERQEARSAADQAQTYVEVT